MRLSALPVETKQGIENRSIIYQYRGENRWLSNFWPCLITLPAEGDLPQMEFDNVEKAYMAWKTTDQTIRTQIQTISPGDAKKLSHTPDFPYRTPYTDAMRIEIMESLIEQKFSIRNPELLDKLLETKNDILAEGNIHGDNFFGIDLNEGYGLNHLGRIQMRVRQKRLAFLQDAKQIIEIDPGFAWALEHHYGTTFEGIPKNVGNKLNEIDKRSLSLMLMFDGDYLEESGKDTVERMLCLYGFEVENNRAIEFYVTQNAKNRILPK